MKPWDFKIFQSLKLTTVLHSRFSVEALSVVFVTMSGILSLTDLNWEPISWPSERLRPWGKSGKVMICSC